MIHALDTFNVINGSHNRRSTPSTPSNTPQHNLNEGVSTPNAKAILPASSIKVIARNPIIMRNTMMVIINAIGHILILSIVLHMDAIPVVIITVECTGVARLDQKEGRQSRIFGIETLLLILPFGAVEI